MNNEIKSALLLIFTGYNPRAVIAFLRTLEKNHISNYALIASSDDDLIFKTVYKKKVTYIRKNRQLDLKEICYLVNYIRKKLNMDKIFIIPSTEALNRFILKNRIILEQYGCIIPLVDEKLYIQISDKESFCKLCKKYLLLIPDEVLLKNYYTEPFVAKPRKYASVKGEVLSPVLVKDEDDFVRFMDKYNTDDFIFQEYINGESYYLMYYFSTDKDVFCLSQKNLIQQLGGKSIIAACYSRMHLEEAIANKYIELFLSIGFEGLVMVELRKNKKGYYMIEANPRLWGPSQLFCDSGYNLFEYFLHDYGFLKKIPKRDIDYTAKYFWSGGASEKLLDNKDCIWHWDNENIFRKYKSQFLKSDIYFRNDTLGIYKYELSCKG